MPRKTKDQNELENKENKRTTSKKTASTKATSAEKSASAKTTAKKTATTKKETAKKSTSAKSTATKKTTTKATAKKTTAKKTATKKATTKKSSSAKSTSTRKATKKSTARKTTTKKATGGKMIVAPKNEIVEYYDLPYRYNQTVVKILAQTPSTLFIYWDISDKDRENFNNQYGENFFENTKPVLIVTNDTMGYSFEVEINDFANSWYLHINDSKCKYRVELGRRPIIKTEKLNVDYIYVSNSNEIETPNDRILLDKNQEFVYFQDIKTGTKTRKKINNSIIKNISKIYNISENVVINNMNILTNPSSGSAYKF